LQCRHMKSLNTSTTNPNIHGSAHMISINTLVLSSRSGYED
jgi:hypothetical protein